MALHAMALLVVGVGSTQLQHCGSLSRFHPELTQGLVRRDAASVAVRARPRDRPSWAEVRRYRLKVKGAARRTSISSATSIPIGSSRTFARHCIARLPARVFCSEKEVDSTK
jgi:hypothetical protein